MISENVGKCRFYPLSFLRRKSGSGGFLHPLRIHRERRRSPDHVDVGGQGGVEERRPFPAAIV